MHLWLRQLRAVFFLSIYFLIEFVFTHKFCLQSFFDPNISAVPPPVYLDIGYLNKLQLKVIYLARFLAKEQTTFNGWYKNVLKNIESRLEAQVRRGELDTSKLIMPIDTYMPGEITGEEFAEKYTKAGVPGIIKGGFKHCKAYKEWNPDFFGKKFADFKVNIIDLATDEHLAGTMKDVVDSRGTERKLYIHNSANIFSYNTHLFDDLNIPEWQPYMGGNNGAQFLGCQLFLGVHKGTGTAAHMANNTNLFFQCHGMKEWTFTHPDYTWLMYPLFNRYFLFVASNIRIEYDDQLIRKHFPLMKYVPQWRAVLEPGDVLLNPTWMWHSIDNVSEESVGVASRWIVPTARTGRFFDMIQLIVPAIWRLKFDGLSTNAGEPVIIDENTRGLVHSHDDYINFGKLGATKKFNSLHKTDKDYIKRQAARKSGQYHDREFSRYAKEDKQFANKHSADF